MKHLLLIMAMLPINVYAKEPPESDEPRPACFVYNGEQKCFNISDEDLEVLKSCGFITDSKKRNDCAQDKIDPFDDVTRFVWWV